MFKKVMFSENDEMKSAFIFRISFLTALKRKSCRVKCEFEEAMYQREKFTSQYSAHRITRTDRLGAVSSFKTIESHDLDGDSARTRTNRDVERAVQSVCSLPRRQARSPPRDPSELTYASVLSISRLVAHRHALNCLKWGRLSRTRADGGGSVGGPPRVAGQPTSSGILCGGAVNRNNGKRCKVKGEEGRGDKTLSFYM